MVTTKHDNFKVCNDVQNMEKWRLFFLILHKIIYRKSLKYLAVRFLNTSKTLWKLQTEWKKYVSSLQLIFMHITLHFARLWKLLNVYQSKVFVYILHGKSGLHKVLHFIISSSMSESENWIIPMIMDIYLTY